MVAQNVGEFETTLGMSADGTKVVALGDVDAWLSSDAGVTWAKAESLTSLSIEPTSVTMSPDGSKILICGKSSASSGLAVSHDSGSTWTELTSPGSYFRPHDCSMSADGQTIAAIANGFEVMVSSDGGSTFSASTSGSRNDNIWKKVLVSKDGSKILVSNTPLFLGDNGNHAAETAGYISLDSGATWTRPTGVSPWIDMAMSDDGSTIYVLADMECSGGGYTCLGGGNSTIFGIFTPIWGRLLPQFDGSHLFSNGLVQPPTRCEFPSTIIWSSFDGGSTWQKESVSGSDRAWWSDIEVTSDGSLVVAIETGSLIGSYGDVGVFHKGWPTTTSTSSTAALDEFGQELWVFRRS